MKKAWVLALLALFLGCTAPPISPTYVTTDRNVEHLMRSTVALVVQDSMTRLHHPYCSGFFVNGRTIVTAAHCAREMMMTPLTITQSDDGLDIMPPQVIVGDPKVGAHVLYVTYSQWDHSPTEDYNGIRVSGTHGATVTALDADHDVATLVIDGDCTPVTEWLSMGTDVHVGETVYSVGHPIEMAWTLTSGMVSQIYRADGTIWKIQASSMIYFGNSGGPLVNDLGRVIGVASEIQGRQAHLGLFSPIRYVQELLAPPQIRVSSPSVSSASPSP